MANLKRVDVIVNDDTFTPNSILNFSDAMVGAMVSFQCKGSIQVYHPFADKRRMPPMQGDSNFSRFLRSIVQFSD